MRIERYNECASFVKELHKKQFDKGGNPYFHHLYEVANNAKNICDRLNITDEEFIFDCMEIALLHDSVEDCDLSFDIIRTKYGNEVAEGVKLMTKPANNAPDSNNTDNSILSENKLFKPNYVDYLARLYHYYLGKQPITLKAMIVKLSDLQSNLNYQRLGVKSINELNQKQLNNLLKYHTAYQLLASIVFNKKNWHIEEFKTHLSSAQCLGSHDTAMLENSIHQIIHPTHGAL